MRIPALALALALTTPALAEPNSAPDMEPTPPNQGPAATNPPHLGPATTPATDISAAMAELVGDWNANIVLQHHLNTEMQTLATRLQALQQQSSAPTTTKPSTP